MRPLTKEEKQDLYYKVENEGFGYYMLDYGPDLDTIERLGFNKEEISQCITLMSKIQSAIYKLESEI